MADWRRVRHSRPVYTLYPVKMAGQRRGSGTKKTEPCQHGGHWTQPPDNEMNIDDLHYVFNLLNMTFTNFFKHVTLRNITRRR